LLEAVGVQLTAIEFCLATGGMVAMPAIREGLIQFFDSARVKTVPNAATIIAEGAAWIAHDKTRVSLAKPIEVLNADNVYLPIFKSGTPLPLEGTEISQSLSMYCVDPRDQKAKFLIARNRWPGREGSADPRLPYGCLTVRVDPTAMPLTERLKLAIRIDHDCIAHVSAQSLLVGDYDSLEIQDLEFGLALPGRGNRRADGDDQDQIAEPWRGQLPPAGAVRVRGNVVNSAYAFDLVPGEIANPLRTARQHDEKMYYKLCTHCDKNAYQIERFGCDRCAERGQALSPFDAEKRWKERMQKYDQERNSA
jgi:hypothetical protein